MYGRAVNPNDLLPAALVQALGERRDLAAAVLFGSGAAGRLRANSDLDLALLFAQGQVPDGLALLDMRGELELLAGRDVDLVVLNGASPIIAHQAIKNGKLLVCRDRWAYETYVMRLVSEYADFKRIRRPIEEAVIKRRVL